MNPFDIVDHARATTRQTLAQWFQSHSGGLWRRARKKHYCDCSALGGLRCLKLIDVGDKYFDTNTNDGLYQNKKRFCIECAKKPAGKK